MASEALRKQLESEIAFERAMEKFVQQQQEAKELRAQEGAQGQVQAPQAPQAPRMSPDMQPTLISPTVQPRLGPSPIFEMILNRLSSRRKGRSNGLAELLAMRGMGR